MRTALRNIDYLKTFAERILCKHNIKYTGDDLATIINNWGTPKEIDNFFDKFTVAFGKHLLALSERSPRTLEHSMDELLKDFRDTLSIAPDNEQIDYVDRTFEPQVEYDTHAPGSCPL